MPPICASSLMRRPLLQRLAHRPSSSLARNLCLVHNQYAAAPRLRYPAPFLPAAPRSLTRTTTTTTPATAACHVFYRLFSTSPRARQEQEPHRYYFAAPPPPPPSPPPRRRRRWISAAVFLLFGILVGTTGRILAIPLPPPRLGSRADSWEGERVRKRAMKLPLVQKLMSDPDWTHHEAYASIPDASRPDRITTGPLSGAEGIGAFQHIFHHRPSHPSSSSSSSSPPPEVIDVIYFGQATTGWPSVVHGGLLATILDEHSARAAVADPALRARDLGVLTANLDVQYRQPTFAGRFYVVRARALPDDELEPRERGKRDRKIWVDVVLETPEGSECVKGRALFVIPRGRQLRGIPEGF